MFALIFIISFLLLTFGFVYSISLVAFGTRLCCLFDIFLEMDCIIINFPLRTVLLPIGFGSPCFSFQLFLDISYFLFDFSSYP